MTPAVVLRRLDGALLAGVTRIAWWAHSKFAISNFQIARVLFSFSAISSLTWAGLTFHSTFVGYTLVLLSCLFWCLTCALRLSRLPRDERFAFSEPEVFRVFTAAFWNFRVLQLLAGIAIDLICATLTQPWYALIFRAWATMFALGEYFTYVPRVPERQGKPLPLAKLVRET